MKKNLIMRLSRKLGIRRAYPMQISLNVGFKNHFVFENLYPNKKRTVYLEIIQPNEAASYSVRVGYKTYFKETYDGQCKLVIPKGIKLIHVNIYGESSDCKILYEITSLRSNPLIASSLEVTDDGIRNFAKSINKYNDLSNQKIEVVEMMDRYGRS